MPAPATIADRHLCGPGPSSPCPEATIALARPHLGHLDPDLLLFALPELTTVRVPQDVDFAAVRSYLLRQHNLEIGSAALKDAVDHA